MNDSHPLATFDIYQQAVACLQGLADCPFEVLGPDGLCVPLELLGDAIRMEIPVPPAVMRRLEALPWQSVLDSLDVLATEPASWLVSEDNACLEWALRRRDQIESARFGARRLLVPQGILPDASPAGVRLGVALSGVRFDCDGKVSPLRALNLLGERRVMSIEWLNDWPDARIGREGEK